MDFEEIRTGTEQELRRGTVVLACLLQLRSAGYGYGLLDSLQALGLPVEANTLYPLLRRLEAQGMLTSQWDTAETRPRKFYRTSPDGERLAAELLNGWKRLDESIRKLDDGGTR